MAPCLLPARSLRFTIQGSFALALLVIVGVAGCVFAGAFGGWLWLCGGGGAEGTAVRHLGLIPEWQSPGESFESGNIIFKNAEAAGRSSLEGWTLTLLSNPSTSCSQVSPH